MRNLDLHALLFHTTTQLHDAAGAVHDHAGSAGLFDVLQLLGQQRTGDLGELHGVGTTEAAAHVFFGARHIGGRVGDEVARGLGHAQATADVAGSVVGHLFTAVVEVLLGQAENIMHEGAVVRHLVGEELHAGGVGLAFQDVGVHMLQVGGAAGAQGDDGVVLAGVEGFQVLLGHIHGGFALTHHFQRQAAAGLGHGVFHGHAAGAQHLDAGFQLFGIDEVLGAAAEDGHTVARGGHARGDLGPAVTEGFVGDGGQGLEAVLAKEHGRQVTLELGAAGEGLLGVGGELEQAVEHLAVLHHSSHQGAFHTTALLVGQAGADLADQAGQVDAAGADVLAGFAAHAVLAQHLGLVLAMEEVGQDQADGADVDVAHLVAAHQTEHGADVGAGAAAHAAEDLGEQRITGDLGTAVVQEDHVHDLLVVLTGAAFAGTGHEGGVRGQALGRSVTGQHLQGGQGHFQVGHQLVQAGDGHMDARQGGDHAGVAFVGHGADGAHFGHGEVAAGDAHVAVDELAAQLHTGHLHQTLDVLGILLDAGLLGEVVGHLIAGQVDGGHDHVRGTFVAQLDDPFTKVGLVHDEPFLFQVGVQLDFFSGHGLGLDDALDVVLAGDAGDDAVGIFGSGGTVHVHAALFGHTAELFVQFFHVLAGVVLGVGDLFDQAAFVHFLEHSFTVGAVGHGKGVEGTAQEAVLKGGINILAVIRKGFGCGVAHGLVLQKNDMQFQRAMNAHGGHALDIGGTAGAADQGRVVAALGIGHEQLTHATGDLGQGAHQLGLGQHQHVDLADHTGQTGIFVVGVHQTGGTGRHAHLGGGQTHVDTGQMVAQTFTDAQEALFLAGGFQGGEVFIVQDRGGHDTLHAGGHTVGAVGALFHILVRHQFARGFVFAHVHHVLQRGGHVGQLLHHGVDGRGFGGEVLNKILDFFRGH